MQSDLVRTLAFSVLSISLGFFLQPRTSRTPTVKPPPITAGISRTPAEEFLRLFTFALNLECSLFTYREEELWKLFSLGNRQSESEGLST